MYNGIINIYKEAGFTSHDVVAKLRGIFRQKKIGHTGTLDPEAVGVLPVCLGKGTKVCDLLTNTDKTYETVMRLGVVTDTQDMTGKILKEAEVCVTESALEKVLEQFRGDYDQIPPMYSALKVHGKKLYELAREGQVIERKPRRVQILELKLLQMEADGIHIHLRVQCSKGTYIRTLCHDIGERLGCGAAMEKLTRTQVGIFKIEDAISLSQAEQYVEDQQIDAYIRSIDSMFSMWTGGQTIEAADRLLYNGNVLSVKDLELQENKKPKSGEKFRIYDSQGQFCAVYAYDSQRRIFKNEKMFV